MNIKAALITAGIIIGMVVLVALVAAFPVGALTLLMGIVFVGSVYSLYLGVAECIE